MIGMQRIDRISAAVPMPLKQEQRMRRVFEMPHVSLSLRPRCCHMSNCGSFSVKSVSVVRGRLTAGAGLLPEVLTSLGEAGKSGTSGGAAVRVMVALVCGESIKGRSKSFWAEADAELASVVPNASLGRPRCP